MRSVIVGVSLMTIPLVSYALAASIDAQKPTTQHPIHVDGRASPATLDDLWAKATLVVDAQVVDVRSANRTFSPRVAVPAGAPESSVILPQTDYVLRVREVLKSDSVAKPGHEIVVRRAGGSVNRGSHVDEYVDRKFAKFLQHGRYALFLESTDIPPSPAPVYFPVAGADSAFQLSGAKVLALGGGKASSALAQLRPEQFIATLRKRGGR